MKYIEINKQKKRIKVIQFTNHIAITGPLGSIQYPFTQFKSKITNSFYLQKNQERFLINKIKTLFKSVSSGWFKELNLNGIGYKSFKMEDKIALDLGYSNLILYKPTASIKIKNLKNKLILFSINKDYLNNIATILRNFSKPDVYKGKGIVFKNQKLKLKKKAKS